MNDQELIEKLLKGERRALAKAITLVESTNNEDRKKAQTLLQNILPSTGKSIRIGITGVPGVGKSTFIESFGLELIKNGHKVAVLAVDPSSPISGGSILGDKTRMENLSTKNEAFIRPSPSSGSLGGVALKTRESILLCEASGFDVILIETVGVGQSEYEVHSMVDFFMVLMLPNAGDELQGIKKGILELAHAIIVNKADDENQADALRSVTQYQSALHLMAQNSFWHTKVLKCSALKHKGMNEIYLLILNYIKESKDQNFFNLNRNEQSKSWMKKLIHEFIELKFFSNQKILNLRSELELKVQKGEMTPYQAAQSIIDQIS